MNYKRCQEGACVILMLLLTIHSSLPSAGSAGPGFLSCALVLLVSGIILYCQAKGEQTSDQKKEPV